MFASKHTNVLHIIYGLFQLVVGARVSPEYMILRMLIYINKYFPEVSVFEEVILHLV